jgi:dihydropteroate synthase
MQSCTIARIEIGGTAPVRLMGVINCSPESFYLGSFVHPKEILNRAELMVKQGAEIIDIGARSTAPYTAQISVEEERERMKVALSELDGSGIPVSIDTMYPEVLDACLRFEIAAINDIHGLANTTFARLAGESGLPLFAMAAFRDPGDPVGLEATLEALYIVLERAETFGIGDIILDPAIGRWTDNWKADDDWDLCRNFSMFKELGRPLLAAVSRKSFIGDLLGNSPESRLAGSLAVTYSLLEQGAAIVRTHDIIETKEIMVVYEELRKVS